MPARTSDASRGECRNLCSRTSAHELALALLRKREGDEVQVQRPRGEVTYVATEVRYTSPEA
jgi:hypothetical protein